MLITLLKYFFDSLDSIDMQPNTLLSNSLSSLVIGVGIFFLVTGGFTEQSFLLFSLFLFIGISMLLILSTEKRQKALLVLLESKLFLASFSIIALFSTYVLVGLRGREGDRIKKMRSATFQALLAFMIAILAHLQLVAAPFFIVWLMAYYLHVE